MTVTDPTACLPWKGIAPTKEKVRVAPTGREFAGNDMKTDLDNIADGEPLLPGSTVTLRGKSAIVLRTTLGSLTIQVALPPVLAGTLKVPASCSSCPALMMPVAGTLDADKLTTGARAGSTLTITEELAVRVP